MKTFPTLSFVISIILTLIFTAGFASPVLADDAPPVTEQEPSVVLDETPPPSEGKVDSANSDQASTQTEDAHPPAVETEISEANDLVEEVLEQLPPETQIVVLDEQGEALPLATQEAEELIYNGDPMWCPAGIAPKPNVGGCSPSFTSFTDDGAVADTGLIAWLLANQSAVAKAGTIWVASNYAPIGGESGSIYFEGFSFMALGASMDDFALTINGGWNGIPGSKTLDVNNPSTINVAFSIGDWGGDIIINNIVFDGVSGANSALIVSTLGNITLNNVNVQNNTTTDSGANLNNVSWNNRNVTVNNSTFNNNYGANTYGLRIFSSGAVTVKNVTANGNALVGAYINNEGGIPKPVTLIGDNDFSFNGDDGLVITSFGAITLNNITANGNFSDGAIISNDWAPTAVPITLTGSSSFSHNGNSGVYISSKGNITIKNFIASSNSKDGMIIGSIGNITLSNIIATDNIQGTGAYIDNCTYHFGTGYCISSVSRNITINGINNFSNNGSDGLRIFSSGNITVSNITANNNGMYADRLAATFPSPQNYDAYGKGIFLHNYGAWTAKPITITGTNTFNGNASAGLFVYSYGAIKASNITANDNGCNTLKDTDPFFCAGAYLDGAGITLTGYGRFSDNARDGLLAYSYNTAITLSNLYAQNNGEFGAIAYTYGDKAASVTISGINTFLNNNQTGLSAVATGVITLNNLTANENGGEGVYAGNYFTTKPMAVIIKGTSTFNGNYNGLYIESYGAITTNGITALYNEYGVTLNNCLNDQNECTAYFPQPVTMNGYNNISFNNENGLEVRSAGVITVSNIVANFNLDGWGAFLDNWWDGAKGGITIKGYGIFSNNGGFHGLTVWSTGAVILTNLTADGNARSGVAVLNYYDELKPANVTITGTNTFNLNNWSGLQIFSFGTVKLNNITANQNNGTNPNSDDFGVFIDNATNAVLARPVTLNGTNTFNNNLGGGLSIASLGAIKVNNIMANGNEEKDGVILKNQFNLFASPITLTGYGVFNQNHSGISVFSNGTITLSNISANSNANFGANIGNFNDATTSSFANFTLLGMNTFNNNVLDGLIVNTDGVVTTNNITANNNGGYGAFFNNSGMNAKNININGVNMFNNNNNMGLYFDTSGSAILNRITANNNYNVTPSVIHGVYGFAIGNITFTCGSLYNNEGYGYNLSGTVITLSGVYTSGTNTYLGTLKLTRACPLP